MGRSIRGDTAYLCCYVVSASPPHPPLPSGREQKRLRPKGGKAEPSSDAACWGEGGRTAFDAAARVDGRSTAKASSTRSFAYEEDAKRSTAECDLDVTITAAATAPSEQTAARRGNLEVEVVRITKKRASPAAADLD